MTRLRWISLFVILSTSAAMGFAPKRVAVPEPTSPPKKPQASGLPAARPTEAKPLPAPGVVATATTDATAPMPTPTAMAEEMGPQDPCNTMQLGTNVMFGLGCRKEF